MKKFVKIVKNEDGQVLVLAALMMVVLMGFVALAIDIGSITVEKSSLQNIADAAALAGAQELPTGDAINTAMHYASLNGKSDDIVMPEVSADHLSLTVTIQRPVTGYFSQIFSTSDSSDVKAKATASVTANKTPHDMVSTSTVDSGKPAGSVSGVTPLGVEDQTLKYGQTYILKEGGGNGSNGNYGGLALGGTGESNFESNLANGYKGVLTVGDKIFTEPGNMSSANDAVLARIAADKDAIFDTVQKGSSRLVTVVIVDSMDVNGRKEVTIKGFAVFFLVSGDGKVNGQYQMQGMFKNNVVLDNSTPGTGTYYGADAPTTTNNNTTTYTTSYTLPQLTE